jgi:hypothetical protein
MNDLYLVPTRPDQIDLALSIYIFNVELFGHKKK